MGVERANGERANIHLLESFVVDEAGGILGDLELALLDLLAKLPAEGGVEGQGMWASTGDEDWRRGLTWRVRRWMAWKHGVLRGSWQMRIFSGRGSDVYALGRKTG